MGPDLKRSTRDNEIAWRYGNWYVVTSLTSGAVGLRVLA